MKPNDYNLQEKQLAIITLPIAEYEAMRLDAERYRWLRSDDLEFIDGMPYVAYDKRMLTDMVTIPLTESELDEAVDQCMQPLKRVTK
jgi:hypothetical protein